MRALCGAIIAAGSLIGMGLACIGVGIRYQMLTYQKGDNGPVQFVEFKHLDTALMVAFVVLWICILIGLGIAFVGLAYHHHRRGLELHRTYGTVTTTPPTTGTGERVSV